MNRDIQKAKEIAEKVRDAGGRTFFVGGYVRDKMLGKDNKDIDIEIHGITAERLQEILSSLGTLDSRKVGDNFGIFALKGYDIDIALPRSEKVVGCGHKDFLINTDPFIGYKKAAERRDFTINAMMEDVLTGEVLDYFGGQSDLARGIIRHVSSEHFAEDPLRVFRAAQFASRFHFAIAPATIELCKGIDVTKLSSERVAEETKKALLKSEEPSRYFDALYQMQHTEWFKEFFNLRGVPQPKEHHPEGDAFVHTMLVLDEAAKLRDSTSNPLMFMVAALCHDYGKAESTIVLPDGKVCAVGHEDTGADLAFGFVERVFKSIKMRDYVYNMVRNHMRPATLLRGNAKPRKFNDMFYASFCPEDMIKLFVCDHLGRLHPSPVEPYRDILLQKLQDYKATMKKPYVTGVDLINMGYTPSERFSKILEFAHKQRMNGESKERTLQMIKGEFPLEGLADTAQVSNSLS